MPPQISSVHGACAADIAGLFEPFDFVLDIQTGTGNFFTEGLLVHNCHVLLLDDLVKDIEAADSLTIRDNTWEWYLSTAYTRLAPGGGVLGLMCMTGDTLVDMADGSQRRLDAIRAGDEIATYERGTCSTSRVAAMKSSGCDSVFKITTTSGKIVRANQRHPFLTITPEGELAWTRVKNLTTAHRIVARKVNGESGKVWSAPSKGANNQPSVEGSAIPITTRKNGQTGTKSQVSIAKPDATQDSNTDTVSPPLTTTRCTPSKMVAVLSAENTPSTDAHLSIGSTNSPSITVTIPGGSEHSSVTTVMPGSGTLLLSKWHLPQQNISDFIADQIASIEPDGVGLIPLDCDRHQ